LTVADPPAVGPPTDLGKGLFGYRKSDVRQLIADRDVLLVEAERRMRASQARIGELEAALAEATNRSTRAEQQLAKLRAQMELLSARSVEVERVASRVRAETERITAWRKRMQTVSGTMAPTVERFRLLLEQVPGRVQEALTPVALQGPALQAKIDAAMAATRPPELRQIPLDIRATLP
jgi:chromosome segregation ATPase